MSGTSRIHQKLTISLLGLNLKAIKEKWRLSLSEIPSLRFMGKV